ncbi:hypothetical protein ACMYQ1_18475 [Shewanella oncorhynchi]|uniref:phage tail tube protein n=1 Tax=Shewanella oncorhynchi TaxID=2726434 RepID=UPI0039EE5E5F
MSEIVNESYIGSAIVYMDGRDCGNVSDVNFAIEQDTKTQPNYRGGGGLFDEQALIKSVKFKATFLNFNNENLALALRGKVEVLTEGEITAPESITAVLDGLADTAFMIDTAVAAVVTNAAGTTTYVVDVDYVVSAGGIRALSSGTITEGEALKVTYTKKAGSALQALTESGKTVKLTIDGINDATGKPWVIKVHKWKPTPTSGLSVIGTDYGSFDIEGGVLADTSIVATGKSKFFVRSAA